MAQSLGIIDLVWRGQQLEIDKGSTLTLGGYQQNGNDSSRGTNYSQEWKGTEVTATAVFKRGMSLTTLWSGGEGELQVKCDTGQLYVFQAFLKNRPKITGGEGGKMEMQWGGGGGEELVSGNT